VALFHDWDGDAAQVEIDRALSLNPSLVSGHLVAASRHASLAEHDQALRRLDTAARLDPLSPGVGSKHCWALFLARRFDEAGVRCNAVLELDEHFLPALDNLKWILTLAGRDAEAAAAFARLVRLEGEPLEAEQAARERYASQGLRGLHRLSLGGLSERAAQGYQSGYDFALEHVALGETEPALDRLEAACAERENNLVFLAVDPRLDPLRDTPRFRDLVRRVGIPPSR
jgi:tetratricopeptide (TPR) repeat protein